SPPSATVYRRACSTRRYPVQRWLTSRSSAGNCSGWWAFGVPSSRRGELRERHRVVHRQGFQGVALSVESDVRRPVSPLPDVLLEGAEDRDNPSVGRRQRDLHATVILVGDQLPIESSESSLDLSRRRQTRRLDRQLLHPNMGISRSSLPK